MAVKNSGSTLSKWTITTTTVLRFYDPFSGTNRVSRYQKKHSPTHLSWSSSNLYQLLPFTTIHSILLVQFTWLAVFLHNLSPSPIWSTSWSGALHLILHISSRSQWLLFATHAHTIAACFAVVPRLYHLFLVSLSLNSLPGTLSLTLSKWTINYPLILES